MTEQQMPLQPLPWQADHWRQLQQARQEDRLPHALLLHGRSGLGKGLFARALAQSLLCAAPRPEACGECRPCRQFAAGSSPDFFSVAPPEDKKTIIVDQIRELIEAMNLTSHAGGRRVAIIEPAEAMNVNAANSLLKTLEEPPAASVLMLVCARPARLPATVRSRCRQLRFAPPPDATALAWLQGRGLREDEARELLALAGRRPLRALALGREGGAERREAVLSGLRDVVAGKQSPLLLAAAWSKEPLAEIIEWAIGWVADALRANAMDDKPDRVMQRLDSRTLLATLDRLYEAEKLRDTSANSQLLLESLLMPLAPA